MQFIILYGLIWVFKLRLTSSKIIFLGNIFTKMSVIGRVIALHEEDLTAIILQNIFQSRACSTSFPGKKAEEIKKTVFFNAVIVLYIK